MSKKILAGLLVVLLGVESIFRFSFSVDSVGAMELLDHEDLVSIIVEQEMYDGMRGEIERYASRVQSRLPNTRVSIFPVDADTHPYVISLLNERLFFEGLPDSSDRVTQRLVGTILIGDVSLPVVHRQDTSFVSLFPYVDFHEPHFFFDSSEQKFMYVDQIRDEPEADVWHSVIHPNTGNLDQDISQVKAFFEKVYDFDAREGRYANVFEDPQVLYMDVDRESQVLSRSLWSAYDQLTRQYYPKVLYRHWTQSFARFVMESFLQLQESEGQYEVPDFTGWSPIDPDLSYLESANDIASKMVVEELMPQFLDVINEKYIGYISRYVHNTGRYYGGNSDVRMDSIPEIITKKDLAAHETILQFNDALEADIRSLVENSLARDIALLVHENVSETVSILGRQGGRDFFSRTYDFVYDNYLFGQKASEITDASQCSIVRGSESRPGESAAVEANKGFDVGSSEADLDAINVDTNAGIICGTSPGAMTQTYWGGNALMNGVFSDAKHTLGSHNYGAFVKPIFSIRGSKKLEVGGPLSIQRPSDCFSHNMIIRPYDHDGLWRRFPWPRETNGTRYSCATSLSGQLPFPFSLPIVQEYDLRFESIAGRCGGTEHAVRLLGRNGQLQSTCDGSSRRLTFKRIPSVIEHVSPTDEEYGEQLQAMSAPNLAIDARRYVDFIGMNGQEVRYNYPNLYNLGVTSQDSREEIASKLQTYVGAYSRDMNELIERIDPSKLTQSEKLLALQLSHRSAIQNYPAANVDFWNTLQSNSRLFDQLVEAIYWLQIDNLPAKYEKALLDSFVYEDGDIEQLKDPSQKEFYEISYLVGKGTTQDMYLDIFPEDKSGVPDPVVRTQLAQRNFHEQVQENEDTFREQLLATQGIDVDLASASRSSSGSGFALTSSEIRAITEGGVAGFDSLFSLKCHGRGGTQVWNWSQALNCWMDGSTELTYSSSDHAPAGSEFDRYAQAINDLASTDILGSLIEDDFSRNGVLASPDVLQLALDDRVQSDRLDEERADFVYSDRDDNGVADTYEGGASYVLDLQVDDTGKYFGEGGNLTVSIRDASGKLVNDSLSRVQIEAFRIDDTSSDSVQVYRDSESSDWQQLVRNYARVPSTPSILSRGIARASFSVSDTDANLYLRASLVDTDGSSVLRSNVVRVVIREELFDVVASTNIAGEGIQVADQYRVGDTDGIYFRMVSADADSAWTSPMQLRVVDVATGDEIYQKSGLGLDNDAGYHFHFDQHKSILTRSGKYRFEFSDSVGNTTSQLMRFLPGAPRSIGFEGSDVLVQDHASAGMVLLYDSYGNIAGGYSGTVEIESENGWGVEVVGVEEEKNGNTISFETSSGEIPVLIRSDVPGTSQIRFSYTQDLGGEIQISETLTSLQGVSVRLVRSNQDPLVVGGNEYTFSVIVTDATGRIVSGLDFILPLRSSSESIYVDDSVVVRDGRGELRLVTGSKTSTDVALLSSIGLPIDTGDFSVVSGEPVAVKMQVESRDIGSALEDSIGIAVSLVDAFGNEYDGSASHSVRIHVEDEKMLTIESGKEQITIDGTGSQEVRVYPQDVAGRGYVYATVLDPSDIFEVIQDVSDITIHGVISADEVSEIPANTIKTYLLGSSYGDSTQGSYLASGFLYGQGAGLASVSLTDTPFVTKSWFHLKPTGELSSLSAVDGFIVPRVDVGLEDGRMEVTVSEDQGRVLAQMYPRFDSRNFVYQGCSAESILAGTCDDLPSSPYVFVAPAEGYGIEGDVGGLRIMDGETESAHIHADGRITGQVDRIVWESTNGRSAMRFGLYAGSNFIGFVEIQFARVDLVDDAQDLVEGSSGLSLSVCSDCRSVEKYAGSSTKEIVGYEVVSRSLDASEALDRRKIGGGYGRGYAQSSQVEGIGWEGENGDIRDFAAGQISAESLRTYQDYLTVHHGDPLLALNQQITSQHGFDRSVGEQIYISDSPISDIAYEDMNNDGERDLVVVHSDGTLALRLDPGSTNLNIGDIAHITNMDEDRVVMGDFFADGYADFAFATDQGALQVLSNNEGVFELQDPEFDRPLELGFVQHIQSFDMDRDGFDDIIVLDSFGSLYVLYGSEEGVFTAQYIEKAFSVQISPQLRSEYFMGSVSYEGADGVGEIEESSDNHLMNTFVYEEVEVGSGLEEIETIAPASLGQEVVDAFDLDPFGFFRMSDGGGSSGQILSEFNALQNNFPDSVKVVQPASNSNAVTKKFIKTPFINPNALRIEKQYQVDSDSILSQGSEIEVLLRITNTSQDSLSEIVVVDDQMELFGIGSSQNYSYTVSDGSSGSGAYEVVSEDPPRFTFDLSGISLSPGASIDLTYRLGVEEYSYGDLRVGLLEKDTDPSDDRRLRSRDVATLYPDLVDQFSRDSSTEISENEFASPELFGDIVFSLSPGCQTSYFLWRSHDRYPRTYAKTYVFDDAHIRASSGGVHSSEACEGTDAQSLDVDDVAGSTFSASEHGSITSATGDVLSSLEGADSDTIQAFYDNRENIEALHQASLVDSDGDGIPDVDDIRPDEIVSIVNDQLVVSNPTKSFVDGVNKSINENVRSKASGFGVPTQRQMPINKTFNLPGNVVTFMGFALKGVNNQVTFCDKAVTCGIPTFSMMTGPGRNKVWPPESYGAGGSFDAQQNSNNNNNSNSNSSNSSNSSSSSSASSSSSSAASSAGSSAAAAAGGVSSSAAAGSAAAAGAGGDIGIRKLFDEIAYLDVDHQWGGDVEKISPVTTLAARQNWLHSAPDGQGNVSTIGAPPAIPGKGISTFRIFNGSTINGQSIRMFCFGPNTNGNPGMIPTSIFPLKFGGNCIYSIGPAGSAAGEGTNKKPDDFQYEVQPYEDDVLSQDALESLSTLGDSIVCVDEGARPGSGNALLYNSQEFFHPSSCNDGVDPIVIQSLRSDIQEVLYGSGQNTDGARENFVQTLSENPDVLTQDVSGSNGSPVTLGTSFGEVVSRLQDAGLSIGSDGSIQLPLNAQDIVGSMSGVTKNIDMFSTKAFPNYIMGWYQDQMNEVVSSFGNLPDSENIFPETGGLVDPGHRRGSAYSRAFDNLRQLRPEISSLGPKQRFALRELLAPKAHAAVSGSNSILSQIVGSSSSGVSRNLGNTAQRALQQYGGENIGLRELREHELAQVTEEKISLDIPHIGADQINSWLTRNRALLQAWKDAHQEGYPDALPMIQSIEKNIETVESYKNIPNMVSEYMSKKEEYVYDQLGNLQSAQDMLLDWQYQNGEGLKDWNQAYINADKQLGSIQKVSNILHEHDLECGRSWNGRNNQKHEQWRFLDPTMPNFPTIDMPRWPNQTTDYSNLDQTLDVAYPVVDFNVLPLELPDAPSPNLSYAPLTPMAAFPKVPEFPELPESPRISTPNLPGLPPAPTLPGLPSALSYTAGILREGTLKECIYRITPIAPEWGAGMKAGHVERQGYLPYDYKEIDRPMEQREFVYEMNTNIDAAIQNPKSQLAENIEQNAEAVEAIDGNLRRRQYSEEEQVDTEIASSDYFGLDDYRLLFASAKKAFTKELDAQGFAKDFEQLLGYVQTNPAGYNPESLRSIIDITKTKKSGIDRFVTADRQELIASLSTMQGVLRRELAYTQDALTELDEMYSLGREFVDLDFVRSRVREPITMVSVPAVTRSVQSFGKFASFATLADVTSVPSGEQGTLPKRSEGIYLSHPVHGTAKLTDYTDDQDEGKSRMLDIDDDSDVDVVYVRGSAVYLKRHQANRSEVEAIRDRPKVYSQDALYEDFIGLTSIDAYGYSPLSRFLSSRFSSPDSLQGSVLDDDRRSRVQAYMHQNIFARASDDPRLPGTKHLVEILDRDGYFTSFVSEAGVGRMRNIPAYVEKARGLVTFSGYLREVTLGEDGSFIDHANDEKGVADELVYLRPGTSVFSSGSDVLIQIVMVDGATESVRIPARSHVVFDQGVRVRVIRGELDILSTERSQGPLGASDLADLPLLPGTQMEIQKGSSVLIQYDTGASTSLEAEEHWSLADLQTHQDTLGFGYDVDAGFYYGSLQSIQSDELTPSVAPQQVFSVQPANDVEPIDAVLPESLRVVRGQKMRVDFSDYVTFDEIASVRVSSSESDIGIRKVDDFAYEFDAFELYDTVVLMVTYADQAGNISHYSLSLIVEDPDIVLDQASSSNTDSARFEGSAVGVSDSSEVYVFDALTGEKLLETPAIVRDGTYDIQASFGSAQYALEGEEGDIDVLFSGSESGISNLGAYQISLVPGDSKRASYISLSDSGGQEQYAFTIQYQAPVFAQIVSGEDLSDLKEGMYLISDSLRLVRASIQDPNVPDGVYIVDTDGRALLVFDAQGMLRFVQSEVSFSHDESSGKFLFHILTPSEEGKLLFVVDAELVEVN